MARPKNKENEIIATALKVFLEKGFSKTSIQDIATEAGIGKGTIYDYFKSKDELFLQSIRTDIRFNAYMLQNLILNYAERYSNTNLSDEQKEEDQVKLINIIMMGVGVK